MEGVLFCDECGQPLVGRSGQTTSQLVQQQTHSLRGRATWGTARFDLASSIVIHVRDHLEPISLVPKQEMLIGRTDTQSDFTPDLDMTPYGAAEYGVSRQHAIIKRGEDTLTLTDLGSTNGTHLNGQRLIPRQPRVLRDGDEIRLGRLVFHIFFK
ncbi:MAG: FHA domain-containing protein [Anaerolineae bacterium]|nr:FHA domain-containing protein [Anaerolineae bacterium]